MKRLSADHYHAAAAKRGFKWVGTTVPGALEKTEWQCGKGHIWKAPYHDVSRRNGCPYCSGQVPKTAGDYALAAHERRLFWIGTLPSGIHKKTRWQCQHGHQWDQTYSNITHNKSNCPICSDIAHGNRRRFTADHYHALAAKRGFKWLGSDVPANIETHTLWECQRGHQWEAVYGNIKKTGCPHCDDRINGQQVSKPQRAIAELIGGELNYPVGRYRIDVALHEHKIAIEYDGWYWHKEQASTKRAQLLASNGWKTIRVKSGALLPTIEQLHSAVAQLLNGEQQVEITLSDWRDI